jgi:hypothetical protein
MAVYRLFKNKAFEPEAIAAMTSAYADICRTLGVLDRDHSEADAVAKKVIEFAQRGEHDPLRLREIVLQALDVNRTWPPTQAANLSPPGRAKHCLILVAS